MTGINRSLYQISIGGTDVSDRIAPWLLQVSVTDKAGMTSDTATVSLDDRSGQFVIPKKGEAMTVDLGTVESGRVRRFTGVVDTVRSQGDRGGGMRLEITGKGMDTTSGIKDPQDAHKDDATLKDAAAEFAKAGGLSSIEVHPSLASIHRPYWAMDGESIIAWGQRVAREVGGTFKIVGDKGVIVPRSAGVSASGKALSTIYVERGKNLITWDIAPDTARPQYDKVVASYYDTKAAKRVEREIEVANSSGSGRKQRVKFDRADEGESDKAGDAEGKDIERDKGGGRVDIIGNPNALAEADCVVSGIRPGVDGTYTIDSVTDTLNRSRGYVTSLDLVKPKVASDKR